MMEKSVYFISHLCASELSMLNDACKLFLKESSIKTSEDVYKMIQRMLGVQVYSYLGLLEQLNKNYTTSSVIPEELVFNGRKRNAARFNKMCGKSSSDILDDDTQCLAHMLLWMLLSNDEARDYVAKEESIRNTSKDTFEEEYALRLFNSKKFVQKVPYYALRFSGLGKVVQRNSAFTWLTVSSAAGVGLSAFTVASVLNSGYVFGGLTVLAESIANLLGKSNLLVKRATPFWIALIFLHLSSSKPISSESMAKEFCLGLVNNGYLQEYGKSTDEVSELFSGWNAMRVGLVVYLWGTLSASGVIFRQIGNKVCIETRWTSGDLNSARLEQMTQELFDNVPLRKLDELRPYAAALIDYLYGLDVDVSLKEKYIQVYNHYKTRSGSKLLVDYCFPYTQVDSNTYCYCDKRTPQGFMTQLYLNYQGLDDSHCLNVLDRRQFDCILVPPLSNMHEFEKNLSPKGQMISIETKSDKPMVASVDQETEYAVVRHDILKRFEEIAFDIDMHQYEAAKSELRSLKDWLSTYFMKKKSVAPVDIEKVLYEQFDKDFTLQIERVGFSSRPLVMVNESDLVIRVLQNLADNFKNHAFASMTSNKQRRVRVKVTDCHDLIEIRISNNGEPIPEELSSDAIFELGVKGKDTGHLGYGCWSMRRCLQCYGGDIRLETNYSIFPTTFILTLPNYESHGNAENK